MKKSIVVVCILSLWLPSVVYAQCTNNNTLLMNFSPACTGSPENITNCIRGGQYVAVTVVTGNVYTFSTCGNTAFDSQITLFNSNGTGPLAFNDDGCGLQSTITWTATFSGNLFVLVDQYPCSNNATCIPLNVTCVAPPPPSSGCLTPLPDICSMACNLGILPAPAPCNGGTSINTGTAATFNMSNVGAIAEIPYSSVTGCAAPSSDVWYRFQATGTELAFNITSSAGNPLNNPNVSLYNGNNCNALLPLACFTGTGGNLSQTFSPITPGDFYYLQVSGGNVADVGDFTLTIRNNYNCSTCLLAQDLQATPAPINGTYAAGQTVQFCFTVSNYNQTAANWLHGIDLNFGPGWNLATLTATTIPPSCATTTGAYWGFFNSVTGSYTGTTYGPGFWYETSSGSPGGAIDGNPGNNFGDVNVGAVCPLTFCWQITTVPPGACTAGTSLAVAINTLGDYESGSWSSPGCQNDPIVNFTATLSCCALPVITTTNATCGLSNGKIRASGNGAAPWDYVWADSSGSVIATHNNINGADSLLSLAAGNYSLTVTDNLGCSVVTAITVNTTAGGTATSGNTGPYCEGQTISLSSSTGGTAYAWSGPTGFTSTVASPAINNATPAMSGTYSVTVTYSAGCTATAATNVNVNPVPLASISPASALICSGNSVTLVASGGSTYLWSNAATTNSISVTPSANSIYSVTVSNANSCTATASAPVNVVTPISISTTISNLNCNGDSSGSVLLALAGGQAPFTFIWSNASATQNLSNVTAGNYSVTVTDSVSCSATALVLVTEPAALQINETHTDAACGGASPGAIDVTISGGTTPYQYLWSDGVATEDRLGISSGTYSLTFTDSHTCSGTLAVPISQSNGITLSETHSDVLCYGQSNGSVNLSATGATPPYNFVWSDGATTQNRSNLTAGTYTVTATDAGTCSASISVSITEPNAFSVSIAHTNVYCNGGNTGTMTLSPSGGTMPYTFFWSDGDTSQNRNFVTAGAYAVTVSDLNNCTFSISTTITEPSSLSVVETHSNVQCSNTNTGSIVLAVNGGATPYSFLWNDGNTNQNRANLAAASYTVTVSDNNQCTVALNVPITSSSGLSVNETSTNVSCYAASDASITVTVAGGNAPYSFAWNDGDTSQNKINIPSGSYTVSVTDDSGCVVSATTTIAEPTLLQLVETHTSPLCQGDSNADINVTVTGGSAPYNYYWSDAISTEDRSALQAGTYLITVTDTQQCTASSTISIVDPAGMHLTSTVENPTCITNPADGTITLQMSGGTTPYQYSWSTGSTQQNLTNVPSGTYTVTVSDANNCSANATMILTYRFHFSVQASAPVTITAGDSTQLSYTLSGVVTDSTSVYTNIWSPSFGLSCTDCSAPFASPSVTTVYQIQVQNSAGCTSTDNVTVTVNTDYSIFTPNAFTPNNDGNNDVFTIYGQLNTLAYLDIQIFNRWGEKVFSSNDHHFSWDGKYKGALQNPGVYVWLLKLIFIDGHREELRKGTVTLIK